MMMARQNNKIRSTKRWLAAALVLGILLVAAPTITHAQGREINDQILDVVLTGLTGGGYTVYKIGAGVSRWSESIAGCAGGSAMCIGSAAVGFAAALITGFFGSLFGFFISVFAWFAGVIVQINMGITSSGMVRIGYPVTLSLANAFFVIAIVIIAIATILRSETYGIKRALFRLVMMAVLINFGLVIAGVILSFTDNLTSYWLNSITGEVGLEAQAAKFGSFFGSMSKPQQKIVDTISSSSLALANASGNEVGIMALVEPLVIMFAKILALLGTLISMALFVGMLLIRYVYLSILLILLPIAWAAYIFPATATYYSRWWNKFIQQALFAPIVVFFMWLAITVTQRSGTTTPQGGSGIQGGALEGTSWGAPEEIGYMLLQSFIVAGLSIGGMMAAQQLGIHIGAAGVNAVKSTVGGTLRGVGGYAGRRVGGGLSRQVTKPPTERKSRVGRFLQSPINAMRRGAQSGVATSFGVTQAIKEHGEKTQGALPTRFAAKQKFDQATTLRKQLDKDKKENKLDAATKVRMKQDMDHLEKEGLALAKRASQHAKESPGLISSTLSPAGQAMGLFGKPVSVKLSSGDLKTIQHLGERVEETETVPVGMPLTGIGGRRAAQEREWAGKQQKQSDLTKAQKEKLAEDLGLKDKGSKDDDK